MPRSIAFVLLLAATCLSAGCPAPNNSNTGNANMAATPANTNAATPSAKNANTNVHGNMNMDNMNMSNMNMGKSDKKAKPKKTP